MTSIFTTKTLGYAMRSLMILMVAMLTANNVMAMTQDVTMQVGETKTLNLPSSFTNMYPYCKATTWMSYGEEYVTITSSSQFSVSIKAKKAFSSPIIVRCNYYYYLLQGGKYVYGGTTYYDFKVTVEGSQPTSISLSPSNVTLERGKSVNLKPILTPSNASTTNSWSTNNAGVATIDNTGHVIGQNPGEATITCRTANGLSATCHVNVKSAEATSIRVSPTNMSLTIGEYSYVTANLTPANTYTTYSWQSNNTSVATVNGSGKVTAVGKGTARIIANTNNGLSDYCYVTVSAPKPSSVSIKSSTTLKVGETETLKPSLTPSNAEATYTWTTSNSNVATVSSNGTVKAIASGTCTVTVKTDNGKTVTCKVTVKEQVVEPTNIHMEDYMELSVGDENTLSPTLTPSNATTTISWSSSNNNVATVENGLVKAVGVGTCYILATTSNNLTARCHVVVTKGETDDNTTPNLTSGWEGSYQFTADVTRYADSEMPFEKTFDMNITNKDGNYYITSMLGCNTVYIIYEGLEVQIIDDSHAEIMLDYNNYLGRPASGGYYTYLHLLNPDEQYTYIDKQVISITRNEDGTTKMSDFYIYAFVIDTSLEYRKEAKYSNIVGKKMESTGMPHIAKDDDHLTIYDLSGRCVYKGKMGDMPSLAKGIYIFSDRNGTTKKSIK